MEDISNYTPDAVTAAQDYKLAVGELSGAWMDFKNGVVAEVIPVLADLIEYVTNAFEIYMDLTEQMGIIRDHVFTGGHTGGGGVASGAGQSVAQNIAGVSPAPSVSSPYSGYNPPGGSDEQTAQAVRELVIELPKDLATFNKRQEQAFNNMLNKLPIILADALERI